MLGAGVYDMYQVLTLNALIVDLWHAKWIIVACFTVNKTAGHVMD
jgi:hypothetical protein